MARLSPLEAPSQVLELALVLRFAGLVLDLLPQLLPFGARGEFRRG